MAYDTSNLKNNQGGSTQEQTDTSLEAGLWEHPETGNQIITTYDPLFGNAQSEGIARLGFVRIGDAPEGSITTLVEQAVKSEQDKAVAASDSKALANRAELAELRQLRAERELAELKATTPVVSETVVEEEAPVKETETPTAPTKTETKKKEDK